MTSILIIILLCIYLIFCYDYGISVPVIVALLPSKENSQTNILTPSNKLAASS